MYLLDTNVVSELRKAASGKADANVAAWASRVDASELFISAITVMEIEMSVMRIERRDAAQGALLRSGSKRACCRSSRRGRCPWTLPSRGAARGSTCLTCVRSATRSSPRPR